MPSGNWRLCIRRTLSCSLSCTTARTLWSICLPMSNPAKYLPLCGMSFWASRSSIYWFGDSGLPSSASMQEAMRSMGKNVCAASIHCAWTSLCHSSLVIISRHSAICVLLTSGLESLG